MTKHREEIFQNNPETGDAIVDSIVSSGQEENKDKKIIQINYGRKVMRIEIRPDTEFS